MTIDEMLFGPGYCRRCGLLKPLAMVAVPGLHEDENGELDGGTLHLSPHDRTGYCFECAPQVLQNLKKKN
jgi:hypothetical protein